MAKDVSVIEDNRRNKQDKQVKMCDAMLQIVALSLMALTSATPIMVNDYTGNYFMPFFGSLQVDRSDERQFRNDYTSDQGYNVAESNAPELQSSGAYNTGHQDVSSYGDYGGGQSSYGGNYNYQHTIPVSEHVEVTRPIAVPVYKDIGIPIPQPVKISVPHPVAIGVPQPYPVAVPVSKPVPIQVIKTIAVPVEKKVPYPVEKHIPVPIEKPVPITIEKHVPVPVFKPYPIKIPIYKTVYHHSKH